MTLVSTVTVGSGGATNIEFTGIAGTGKDLMLLVSGRNTSSNFMRVRPNNDTTAANYARRRLYGDGSSVGSDSWAFGDVGYFGDLRLGSSSSTANTFGNALIYITNYAASAAKSLMADTLNENNATAADQQIDAGIWNSTAAITSLVLIGNFAQHSTASLYIIS